MNTHSGCGDMRNNVILFSSCDIHVQLLGGGASRGKVGRAERGLLPTGRPATGGPGSRRVCAAPALQFGVWRCEFVDVGAGSVGSGASHSAQASGHAATVVSARELVEQEEDYLLTGLKKVWHA